MAERRVKFPETPEELASLLSEQGVSVVQQALRLIGGRLDIEVVDGAPPRPVLEVVTAALEECRTLIPAVQAGHVLTAMQGLYVPPPPGSDRDKLPDRLLAVIEMEPYLSTYCQTAAALEEAARTKGGTWEEPGLLYDVALAATRAHAACRLTRKQDMGGCVCPHHRPPEEV